MTPQNSENRKLLASRQVYYKGCWFRPGVVETENGRVVDCYPLTDDMAITRWTGSTLIVDAEGGITEAP